MLTAGIIEARGAERFALVAGALENGPLKKFYQSIARSERRHYTMFRDLAGLYLDQGMIADRWDELLDIEAAIVRGLPLRAALHCGSGIGESEHRQPSLLPATYRAGFTGATLQ